MKKNIKETLAHINAVAEKKATDFVKKVDNYEENQKQKKAKSHQKIESAYKKIFYTRSFSLGVTDKELCKICIGLIIISYPLIFILPHLHAQMSQTLLSGTAIVEDILFSFTKTAMIVLTYFLAQKIEVSKLQYLLLPCVVMELVYDFFIFGKIEMSHQSPTIALLISALLIIGLKEIEKRVKKKSLCYLLMCAYVNLCWYFIIGTNPEHGVLIFLASVLFYLFRNYLTAGLLLLLFIGGILMQGLLCCILAAVLIFFKDYKTPETLGKAENVALIWIYPTAFTISAIIEKIFL